MFRQKPYGTIVEGSVGYQDDTHQASQMMIVDNNKGCEEKSLLILNENSMKLLTPFSGIMDKRTKWSWNIFMFCPY